MVAGSCKCGEHSGQEAWHGKASGYHYHRCRCPECTKAHQEQNSSYYVSHPRVAQYPDRQQYKADWYQDNKERCDERAKRWREDNPDRSREFVSSWRLRNLDVVANKERRRRALKRANDWEPYTDRDIFIRDGWICQLCHKPIDPEAPRNSRYGATIDHTIPISKGGPDTPANVQAAHWICNVRKNDKILAGV